MLDVLASAGKQYEAACLADSGEPDEIEYNNANLAVLRGLDRIVQRPDYYLIGDFNHIDPVTEHDVLWAWSGGGFLTTSSAAEMLELEEGDTFAEIAAQLDIPSPQEEALALPAAAAILGDQPFNGDPTFSVRRRIGDGRLSSYFPSDVEARRAFEADVDDPGPVRKS